MGWDKDLVPGGARPVLRKELGGGANQRGPPLGVELRRKESVHHICHGLGGSSAASTLNGIALSFKNSHI